MKKSNSIRTLSGIFWALTFGIFLLWGSLTSSDFSRGLYGPPDYKKMDMYERFDSLNQNIVWNYRFPWKVDSGITVHDYLDSLNAYGMRAILRKGDHDYNYSNEDSIPYFVEYYSYGNYNKLQAEFNYEEASRIYEDDGTAYYYFHHDPEGVEIDWNFSGAEGGVVKRAADAGGNSYFMRGIYLPSDGLDSTWINNEPEFDFRDMFGYAEHGRHFINRFRLAIDTTGYEVAPDDTLLEYRMELCGMPDPYFHNPFYVRKDHFGTANREFKEFSVEGFADTNYYGTRFKFFTREKVDVFVDWVEYMDREQGYYLFWDDDTRDSTLQVIATQCSTLQAQHPGDIAGWAQSDEPFRSSMKSRLLIHDYLLEHQRQKSDVIICACK